MAVGLDSYNCDTKEQWRNWWWNRIAERCCLQWPKASAGTIRNSCRNKLVLYLVGPEDRDRPAALTRHFGANQLIAVDQDKNRVEAVRSAGHLAIHGDLKEVVLHWPIDWRIDVLSADLCCALSKNAIELAAAVSISFTLADDAVLAFNLVRGNDAASNDLRQEWNRLNDLGEYLSNQDWFNESGIKPGRHIDIKHRGAQLVNLVADKYASVKYTHETEWLKALSFLDDPVPTVINSLAGAFVESCRACYASTPSSNPKSTIKLDSVIFRRPALFLDSTIYKFRKEWRKIHCVNDSLKNQIAAVKAHWTRRQQRMAA